MLGFLHLQAFLVIGFVSPCQAPPYHQALSHSLALLICRTPYSQPVLIGRLRHRQVPLAIGLFSMSGLSLWSSFLHSRLSPWPGLPHRQAPVIVKLWPSSSSGHRQALANFRLLVAAGSPHP